MQASDPRPGKSPAYRFIEISTCNMCGSDHASVVGRRLNRAQGIRPTRKSGVTVTVMRCQECGLLYSNPLPIPLELGQHYDVPPTEYWHDEYFDSAAGYFADQIDTFLSLWTDGPIPRALDIGAGVGKAMNALERAGFDVTGIEPSSTFREAAIQNGIPADRLRHADIESADFPAASFDLVTFGAVLEHLYDPSGAIERALCWTADRGLIHIEVPSARWLTSRVAHLVYRLQGLDYVPYISPMHPPYHLYEFTIDAFNLHGARAGYTVARQTTYVAMTYLPRPLSAIGARYMKRTGTGMQLEVWLSRRDRG